MPRPEFLLTPVWCREPAFEIFTGSVLPAGADAVVMQEDVVVDAGSPELVSFREKVAPWENVRFRGEDVKQGDTLVEAGEKLTEPRLSLLAAAGHGIVTTTRQPIAGFIATGNELQEGGNPLAPGAIYESNRIGLAALARRAGAIAKIYPIVRDDFAATREALELAFSECDLVVSTGGVSVGDLDWVKPAFEAMAGKLEFWKVAIRPGKPFAFGHWQGKFFFGLPGNPVSAMVTFTLLVRPALLRLQGAREVGPRPIQAELAEPLNNPTDRRHFMRVALDAGGKARLAGAQASHILSGLSRADGLVSVSPKSTLPFGTIVDVIPWS